MASPPRCPCFNVSSRGTIINIVSTAGIKILPTMGVYAATKNAVRTLITEALRQEAGPHLRVTEISPGMISTNFADSMTDPAVKEAMGKRIANVAISPDAVARGVAYAIEQPADVDVRQHRHTTDGSGLTVEVFGRTRNGRLDAINTHKY